MKNVRILFASVLLAAMVGCSVSTGSNSSSSSEEVKPSTEPMYTDVVLTDDETSKTPKTEFSVTTPKIFVFFGLKNMKPGAQVKGAWYIDKSAVTKEPNYKIDEAIVEVKEDTKVGNFSLGRSENDWPEGDFRVDLCYNEQVLKSVKFTFKK